MCHFNTAPFVGLTGGIGSGKTLVSDTFKKLGVFVVDTDVISHQIGTTEAFKEEAIKIFGRSILTEEGMINRRVLGKIFFTNENKKKKLESFIHPLIQRESIAQMSMLRGNYGILVVPLLFEKEHYLSIISRSLLVDCTEAIQIQRVRVRNGVSETEAKTIISQQMSREDKQRRADDILENNRDKAWVVQEVERLHSNYMKLFS